MSEEDAEELLDLVERMAANLKWVAATSTTTNTV
jgi:hypothetical protein